MTRLALALGLLVALCASARADEMIFRGNYWRDRNTRVLQPEVDIQKELPSGTVVGGHYLLDTITSASVAAGALRDQPFTELRNEAGLRLGQRIGPVLLGGAYQFSQESDYRSQMVTLSAVADLAQKNTAIGVSLSYNHDNVWVRMGPTQLAPVGSLDVLTSIFSLSQVLSQRSIVNLSYELRVVGFGSGDNGFQANPYRPVNVQGSPTRENVPFQRIRHTVAASLYFLKPLESRIVPWIAFRPGYRFYTDDWGVQSHTPSLAVHLPIGPLELRVTGRYYTQSAAVFFSADASDTVMYTGQGLPCTSCTLASARTALFYTADPKLSEFSNAFLEVRLLVKLRFLDRVSRWLGASLLQVSYGHFFTSRLEYKTFGDAHIAALELQLPL